MMLELCCFLFTVTVLIFTFTNLSKFAKFIILHSQNAAYLRVWLSTIDWLIGAQVFRITHRTHLSVTSSWDFLICVQMQRMSLETGPRPTLSAGGFRVQHWGDPLPRGETGTKNDVVMTPFRVRLDKSMSEWFNIHAYWVKETPIRDGIQRRRKSTTMS